MTKKQTNILILEDKEGTIRFLKNILFPNDEETIRLLKKILPNVTFNLQFAKSQKELLEKSKEEIDLIITDLKVHKNPNGICELVAKEYFEQIHNCLPHIEIIILTGSSSEEFDEINIKNFWKEGPYFWLNKGTSPVELILTIINFCLKSNDNNNYPTINYEKGKALEDLMTLIFNSIDGFSIDRNVPIKTGEIDIMILNEISNSRFWNDKCDNIPVECKNRKEGMKEGVGSLNNFKNKIQELKECKLGFFVSTQGFSEKHLNTLSSGEKYVVPIDDYRIKELIQSDDNRILLLKKYIAEVSQERDSLFQLGKRHKS
ncbi:MAG: response regulator [Planctomycetes bacterium]|nr:response regulator [Planctomycetota bacterium]